MSGNNESTSEFDEFVKSGDVEIGESNLASESDEQPEKAERKPSRPPRVPKSAEAKPEAKAAAAGDDDDDKDDDQSAEGDEGDEDDEQEEKPAKKPRSAKDRILELNARNRDLERRLSAVEKNGLPSKSTVDKPNVEAKPAPDPLDADKYPLGHLDDRYIEDRIEWVAEKKATERADAVLQRQQENEQIAVQQQQQAVLLEKVDDLADRGSDLHDDYQELVVEGGMRGDWDLSQTTFEACHEADNGAAILLALAQDKKEATRVNNLSPLQQLKYVQEKDAEIGKTARPRTKPQAGEPPKNTPRGANSRVQINPATDNLDDFEKQWEREAKAGHR